jgi:hypothetical protein
LVTYSYPDCFVDRKLYSIFIPPTTLTMRSIKQVTFSILLIAALALAIFIYRYKVPDVEYETTLTGEGSLKMSRKPKSSLQLLATIPFQVLTDNTKDFKDRIDPWPKDIPYLADKDKAVVPWASLEKPEEDIPYLVDKDKVVVPYNQVIVIIDYPLYKKYSFELNAPRGFTREMLLREISKHYHQFYQEEEKTAKIKTVPLKERRELAKKNKKDQNYDIGGHYLEGLVITQVIATKTPEGTIQVLPSVDSYLNYSLSPV